MLKQNCDLHTHSVYSDGTDTPSEIVENACRIGLSAVALTDHNTASGLPRFLAAAEGKPIEAVAGIEFSADHCGKELHVLALFVQPRYFGEVDALMDTVQKRKDESNRALIAALAEAGCSLDYDALKAKTPNGQINRAHIAAALTEKGYTASVSEAFEGLLSEKQGFYKPPKRLGAYEVIEFIRSIRALPVLAHPFLNLTEEELRAFLPEAVKCGLSAMETVYPLYDAETTETARAVAVEFGLLESGGSDFHGTVKPDIALGTGKGNISVPYSFFEALKARAETL